MSWFKERGGNATIVAIFAAIVAAVVIGLFGNGIEGLALWKKVAALLSFVAMIGVIIGGDRIKLFAPNDEKKWKAGFGLWIVAIVILFAITVALATSGAPLKG